MHARWSTRRTLGLAFQLTNIIRDVGEDVRRNRIYLPLDELARFGMTTDDVVLLKEDDRFARLMAFQIERARELLRCARLRCSRRRIARAQRPGLVMAAIYRTLLDEIEASGAQGAESAHLAYAAAQAVDCVEDVGNDVRSEG